METKRIAKGAGKVMLALLGAALAPILIWVALGVVITHRVHEKAPEKQPAPTIGQILAAAGLKLEGEAATGQPLATTPFMRVPAPELNKVLAKANLTVQEQAVPMYCWEVLTCPPGRREACPAYARRDVPS
jgi:hypothetical protein